MMRFPKPILAAYGLALCLGAPFPASAETLWQTFTWQAPQDGAYGRPPGDLDRAGRLDRFRKAQARIVDERLARARDIPAALLAERKALAAESFVKDEFETTSAFQARIKTHNQKVTDLNERIQAFLDSAPMRLEAEELAPITVWKLREVYGDPVLGNIRYDADAGVFLADLGPPALADLGVPDHVAIKVDLQEARSLKRLLLASRPELTFEISSDGALRFRGARVVVSDRSLALEATDATALASAPTATLAVLAPGVPSAENRDWVVPTVTIQDPEVARLEKAVLEKKGQQAREEAKRRQKAELEAQLASLDTPADGGPDDLGPRLTGVTRPPDSHRYAFVVGVSTYDSVAPVSFADRAAELFGRFATTRLGVPESQTVVLTNGKATGTAIKGRLKGLLNRVQRGDTVYVYYAGHGLPGRDGNGTYLVPSDCVEGSYEDPELRLDALCAALEGTGAGRIVVVLDACFAGKSGPKDLLFKGVAPVRIVAKGPVIDPARTTLLLASGAEQFANEYRDHSNRLFSYWLLKGLVDHPDDLAGAFTRARAEVDRLSRVRGMAYTQTPELVGRALP